MNYTKMYKETWDRRIGIYYLNVKIDKYMFLSQEPSFSLILLNENLKKKHCVVNGRAHDSLIKRKTFENRYVIIWRSHEWRSVTIGLRTNSAIFHTGIAILLLLRYPFRVVTKTCDNGFIRKNAVTQYAYYNKTGKIIINIQNVIYRYRSPASKQKSEGTDI